MLQSIRDNAQGVLVWIVVGLIVLAFTVVGLGSYFSGSSKVVAASVNGTEISSTALTRAHQNYQERLRGMFGDQYRPEMFNTSRVKNEVLQGLITQEVMNQMLFEQGYQASNEQVLEKLKKYEAFHDDGAFSAERYKEVLSLQGLNGEAFENDLSRDIASQQLKSAITSSAFLTDKEQQVLAALENQKREVAYFEVAEAAYKKSIKISDAEIKASYEKNSHLYLTQEKVQLEYLELNMDAVAARQDISDEMIKQQYENSAENYMQDDEAAARTKLAAIRKQIKQGASFAELAKKHSQDTGSATQGGELGYLTRGVEENFDKAVFALKKGEVSKVIKSKSGFQIVQVDDIRKGDPEERKVRLILIKAERKLKAFADVKVAIKKELQYQQAGKVFFDDADQINNLSYESPDSLEPVAEALGMKVKTSGLMTRRGGGGLLSNPKVLSAAFSEEVLKNGRNSELLELSDTQLVVLRVKEHKTASVQPLTLVKSKIKASLLKEQAQKKVSTVTDDVLARLKNNENISTVQKQYSEIKWNKAKLIARKADKKSSLPSQVRAHAFAMAKPQSGQPTWGQVTLASGGQAVVALYKVEESKVGLKDQKRFAQITGNADYSAFVEHLKSQADISISQATVEAEIK